MLIIEKLAYDMPETKAFKKFRNTGGIEDNVINAQELITDTDIRSYMAKKQKQKKTHESKYSTDGSKMSKPAPKQKKSKKK